MTEKRSLANNFGLHALERKTGQVDLHRLVTDTRKPETDKLPSDQQKTDKTISQIKERLRFKKVRSFLARKRKFSDKSASSNSCQSFIEIGASGESSSANEKTPNADKKTKISKQSSIETPGGKGKVKKIPLDDAT